MESGAFRKKRKNYAQVSNSALLDKNLSLKAKGLYSLIESLLSIPNFTLYKDYLVKCSTDGKSAFDSAWKELKDNGYLIQDKIQTNKGFIYEYELLDEATEQADDNNSSKRGEASIKEKEAKPAINVPQAPMYRKSIPGESMHGNSTDGESTLGKSGSKNNSLEKNILENNTYQTTNKNCSNANSLEKVVVDEDKSQEKIVAERFFGKIEVEKERTRQAYQLEEGCYVQTDTGLKKVILALNNKDRLKLSKLSDEQCWQIYYTYLLLKGAIPDYLSEKPQISKSPEAYIVGMMKNMIG